METKVVDATVLLNRCVHRNEKAVAAQKLNSGNELGLRILQKLAACQDLPRRVIDPALPGFDVGNGARGLGSDAGLADGAAPAAVDLGLMAAVVLLADVFCCLAQHGFAP